MPAGRHCKEQSDAAIRPRFWVVLSEAKDLDVAEDQARESVRGFAEQAQTENGLIG